MHRERELDVKTDVAARMLRRRKRELPVKRRGAPYQSREADCRQMVRRQGIRRAPIGEVVFIHASVVKGAEVLVLGTEARTKVVRDPARGEGVIEPERRGARERGGRKRTKKGQAERRSK